MVRIYELIDPRTGLPRYVGKTKSLLSNRLSKHIYDGRKCFDHKANWLKQLMALNLRPIIALIDEVLEYEWQFWERHYISLYRSWGFDLLNMTDGGDELQLTPEILKKRREWLNNNKLVRSVETRKRIGLSQIGKKRTDQHKNNLSIGITKAYADGKGHRSKKKIIQNDRDGNFIAYHNNVHDLMQYSPFNKFKQDSIYNACRLGIVCGGFKLLYA